MKSTINWKNIYYMLCYCVEELEYFKDDTIDSEKINGTNDLLAELLVKSFNIVCKSGYLKRYKKETILTNKPRGKIDLAKSISTGAYYQGKLYCRVDTLDFNNKLNQIIKSTFEYLIRLNKISEDKITDSNLTKLYYCMNMLKGVDTIPLSIKILNEKIDIPRWYKPVIAICKLIIENKIALDRDQSISLFSLDNRDRLCYIWEKYLRRFIRKSYPMYKVEKRTLHFSNADYVIPDILIIDEENSRALVVDAKWYESERFSNANMAELGQNCAVIQNERNFGNKYKVNGINVYASSDKFLIRKPRELDTLDTLYTDSFVSVNIDKEEMEKQILEIVEQGFNLTL